MQLNPALTGAVRDLTLARFALRASNQVSNCLLQRKMSEIAPRFEWKRRVTQIWLAWRADSTSETWCDLANDASGERAVLYRSRIHINLA